MKNQQNISVLLQKNRENLIKKCFFLFILFIKLHSHSLMHVFIKSIRRTYENYKKALKFHQIYTNTRFGAIYLSRCLSPQINENFSKYVKCTILRTFKWRLLQYTNVISDRLIVTSQNSFFKCINHLKIKCLC